MGSKTDLIIRDCAGMEVGYGEASINNDIKSSRNLYDGGLKGPQVTKDIFCQLGMLL